MPELSLSSRSGRTGDSPISYFIQKALETPGLISLAAGLVDESALPSLEIAKVVAEMMANPTTAKAALQYGSTQGLPALRTKILEHVCRADGVSARDVNLSPTDVILTTGSQQMLYLLGEVLFDPGDIVIVESPSYFVYHDCLKSAGVRVVGIPMGPDGMDLMALEGTLTSLEQSGELKRLKLIYTVDYYQNPTGLTLAADRRPKLLELAKRFSKDHRILILEDAAYRELRFDGPDIPSIKRWDTTNEYVIYTSTFSKPCSPGLKTGYSFLPRDLIGPICNLKGGHDFGSSNLNQHILNRLVETGVYSQHAEKLRSVYRKKRDAVLTALKHEFADWPEAKWSDPKGGFYVWLTLPKHIETGRSGKLVERAVQEGMLYVPGEYGHVPNEHGHIPRNEIRLSYGVAEPPELTEGIRRLRRACRGLERG
jgi:2-aminoadipate transaminase